MNDVSNIFEKGCLIQLEISIWGNTKKLPRSTVKTEADPEYIKASKVLIDPAYLEPMRKIAGKARNRIRDLALPFPIDGMLFVPKEMIGALEEWLQGNKEEFDTSLNTFVFQYADARAIARQHLGPLFSDVDYPVNIDTKFGFSWRFVMLTPPGKEAGILSPELYQREKEKFMSLMEEAELQCIGALREEFRAIVDRMVKTLSDPDKVFRDTLTGNFKEFFDTFSARNCFGDSELAELVEQAKKALNGTEPQALRENKLLRDAVANRMQTVKDEFDKRIISRYGTSGRMKRTLDLSPDEPPKAA
jgi:hypothetical protein